MKRFQPMNASGHTAMNRLIAVFSASLLMILFLGTTDAALSRDGKRGVTPQPAALRKTAGTPVSTMININNIAGWIGNDGKSALNPTTGQAGVYYPRGTTTAIFQDGIVWGGNVNDGGSQVLRVGGQTYSIGTQGGKIISAGVAEDPGADHVRIYRIRRDYFTADLTQDASDILGLALTAVTEADVAGIRAQYDTDWRDWPPQYGAPFYDNDGVPGYQPQFNSDGSPRLDPAVDQPGIADADQVSWFVCNDLNSGLTNSL